MSEKAKALEWLGKQLAKAENQVLAIPMEHGREILLQSPTFAAKTDLPYIEILEKYVALMKKEASRNRNHDHPTERA